MLVRSECFRCSGQDLPKTDRIDWNAWSFKALIDWDAGSVAVFSGPPGRSFRRQMASIGTFDRMECVLTFEQPCHVDCSVSPAISSLSEHATDQIVCSFASLLNGTLRLLNSATGVLNNWHRDYSQLWAYSTPAQIWCGDFFRCFES